MVGHSFRLSGTAAMEEELTLAGRSEQGETLSARLAGGPHARMQLDLAVEVLRQGLVHKHNPQALTIRHEHLAPDRPAVLVYPEAGENLPVILFLHGLNGSKLNCLSFGVQLAEAGFFAVLPDAYLHGERRTPEWEDVFSEEHFVAGFLRAVRETAADLELYLDALASEPACDAHRAGLAGISMGGFVTFLALTLTERFRAAAPLVASPDWDIFRHHPELEAVDGQLAEELSRWNPLANYRAMLPAALLVQNGADDVVVPPAGSRRLAERLAPLYAEHHPDSFSLIEYPGVGHEVTEDMTAAMMAWFSRHLGG